MNLDAEAERYAGRAWDADRRDGQNHARQTGQPYEKLVIMCFDELRRQAEKAPESSPYTGRWAICPRCSAGLPSEFLTRHFPAMIEERLGVEHDAYKHEC